MSVCGIPQSGTVQRAGLGYDIETLVVVFGVLVVIALFVLLKRRSGLRRVRFLGEVSRQLDGKLGFAGDGKQAVVDFFLDGSPAKLDFFQYGATPYTRLVVEPDPIVPFSFMLAPRQQAPDAKPDDDAFVTHGVTTILAPSVLGAVRLMGMVSGDFLDSLSSESEVDTGDKFFQGHFLLASPEPERARALFDQGMRDAIHEFGTAMGDFKLYLYGSTELTVYKMDDPETIEEVQRLVDLAGRILKRLHEA